MGESWAEGNCNCIFLFQPEREGVGTDSEGEEMLRSFLILRRLDSHTTLQRLKAEREPQVVEESRSQLEALEGEGGAGEGEEIALGNGTQEAEREGAWTLRVTDPRGSRRRRTVQGLL